MIPLENIYEIIYTRYLKHFNVNTYTYLPYGSVKFFDLTQIYGGWFNSDSNIVPPMASCILNDQEPIGMFEWKKLSASDSMTRWQASLVTDSITDKKLFMKDIPQSLSGKVFVTHSELHSLDVATLEADYDVIPIYYWWHGLVARSWFNKYRFFPDSEYTVSTPSVRFLLYCRAFTGTREYRLKLLDGIAKSGIAKHFYLNFSPIDEYHYSEHTYLNEKYACTSVLEDYFSVGEAVDASASAKIDLTDFRSTFISVVAETVFDNKVFLTEKICKCFAAGHPFILLCGAHSLQVLRNYGFQTFNDFWDEGYDDIEDGYKRIKAITKLLKKLAEMPNDEFVDMCAQLKEIVDYNQRWFFSEDFENMLIAEMDENFKVVRGVEPDQFGGDVFVISSQILDYPADELVVPSPVNTVSRLHSEITLPALEFLELNYPAIADNVHQLYETEIVKFKQLVADDTPRPNRQ